MERAVVYTVIDNPGRSPCTDRWGSATTTSSAGSLGPDPTCRYTARMAARAVHDHDSAEGLVPLETARETVLSQIHPLPK